MAYGLEAEFISSSPELSIVAKQMLIMQNVSQFFTKPMLGTWCAHPLSCSSYPGKRIAIANYFKMSFLYH
jgi:putative component of membrane protein insertase Oxa1/YidC/SpoIIIJ protein YidD